MSETPVSAVRCREKPKYTIRALDILKSCREFYEDPENERAFQEWKQKREGTK